MSAPNIPPSNGSPLSRKLVTAAVVLPVVVMGVSSMTMNAIAGARLFPSVFSSVLIVAVLLASDGLKLNAATWIHRSLAGGHLFAAAMSTLLMVITVVVSLGSAYSFGVSERLIRVTIDEDERKRRAYVSRKLKAANDAKARRDTTRPSKQILAERTAILTQGLRNQQGTVGDYTAQCTRPTPQTRTRCDRYNALASELAAAQAAEDVERSRLKLEAEALAALRNAGPVDAQLAAFAEFTGWSERGILHTIAWCLAILCEIGSTFGLYLARRISGVFGGLENDKAGGGSGESPMSGASGGSDASFTCPLADRASQGTSNNRDGIKGFNTREDL